VLLFYIRGQKVKKIIKKVEKQEKLKKIKNDRMELNQDLGWLFRPLALCPFPSKPLQKREVKYRGKTTEEHGVLWERKAGKFSVEIIGHPDYGVPYGQDTLIILFLAIEARKQGKRKIKIDFYRDFCRMFDINSNDGRRYRQIVNSLNRIRHSQFSWSDKNIETRQKGLHYIYIEELDLFCDPKYPDQKPLYDQYILLSERFWDEINKHKIPFNLEAVRYLKGKAGHLNYYIWLSYRVALNFLSNKNIIEKHLKKISDPLIKEKTNAPKPKTDFIPFWGPNGLIDQLSTQITRRPTFRLEFKKWHKQAKELWPDCPAEIEGDALKILCTEKEHLDVQLDKQIEAGMGIRKEIEEKKKEQKHCTSCDSILKYCRGKKDNDNRKIYEDYYHCFSCEKNFSKNKYPELFEKNIEEDNSELVEMYVPTDEEIQNTKKHILKEKEKASAKRAKTITGDEKIKDKSNAINDLIKELTPYQLKKLQEILEIGSERKSTIPEK